METDYQLRELSQRVLKLARDNIIISMRFMDMAINQIKAIEKPNTIVPKSDGERLYYDAASLLKRSRQDKAYATRLYLHVMMHFTFSQPYFYSKVEGQRHQELFSLACDIITEHVVMQLQIPQAALVDDVRRQEKIRVLLKYIDKLSAHSIYKYFLTNEISDEGEREYKELFCFDDHSLWTSNEMEISLAQWRKLSERIKTDIKTFSKDITLADELTQNLDTATRDRYDYADILRRFTIMGENAQVNTDEFDYIYYTYGMTNFKNMPMIEPLEYIETKKIKEFVVVIDTSASCKGNIVRSFLNKTYNILKGEENFFSTVNIHILQCDNSVHQDIKIENHSEFEEFLKNGKLTGFGGTDYRPAFLYVEDMIRRGEFENLKGVIYFTDGYGIYPDYMPEFESMFVFLNEDDNRPMLPAWAIKVVLPEEELDEY